MPGRQSRRWIATLNNYQESHLSALSSLVPDSLNYLLYGKEVAPSTNTPHLQIYLETQKKKTLNGLKKLLGIKSIHLEIAEGTQQQNLIYCKKDGQFFEIGKLMESGTKKSITEVSHAIANGANVTEIARNYTETFIRYPRGIERAINLLNNEARDFKTFVKVYYGKTGTGKSYKAHQENPELWTHGGDRWFDNYAAHEVALFDDFEGIKSGISFRKLLQLCDRYPLVVPVKNSFVNWRPKVIIFTTNVKPEQWYPEDNYAPLRRRIDELIDFDMFPYNGP
ncbi:replication-associated protein [Circoviridae 14 LDMD-2013]|uniref:replication-associated protein n=1 Tax=Circoviridae 14 LDMD-2013 TaxID=1379718 RepID=UPI0003844F18|nr:replication-associated protein [Circoviridae 14 LDMD-2013]AGS36220.1 replication-associated protein [Circoviridae 14 LDMD-2013]